MSARIYSQSVGCPDKGEEEKDRSDLKALLEKALDQTHKLVETLSELYRHVGNHEFMQRINHGAVKMPVMLCLTSLSGRLRSWVKAL